MTTKDKIAWMHRGAMLAFFVSVGSLVATAFVYLAHAAEWLISGRITHMTISDVTGLDGMIGHVPLCFLAPIFAFATFYVFFGLWNRAVQKDIEAHPTR